MNKLHHLGFCVFLCAASAFAQNNKSDITVKDINLNLSPAPTYELQSSARGKSLPKQDTAKTWLLVEADLESRLDWADEVQVKFYVVAQYAPNAIVDGGGTAGKLPDDQQYNILTTTVTVVNMQKTAGTGKRNIVPVFIDPNTVRKFGEGNLQKFIPEVAVEVSYKGILQDLKWKYGNETKPGRFWEKKQPKTGVLLNLLQSPWWPAYSDYYERVKPFTPPAF